MPEDIQLITKLGGVAASVWGLVVLVKFSFPYIDKWIAGTTKIDGRVHKIETNHVPHIEQDIRSIEQNMSSMDRRLAVVETEVVGMCRRTDRLEARVFNGK